MANGVLLTTPITLIALLRTVALGWQQETLAESAREVQKLGAELYDRLRIMTGHMQTLQRSLTSSVEAYNKAVGSFESRVLVSARKFPGLGVVGGEGPRSPSCRRSRRHRGTCRRSRWTTTREPASRGVRTSSPCPRAGPARAPRPESLRPTRPSSRAGASARRQQRHHGGRGARTPATYSAEMLHVHRSERADALVSMLAELVADAARRPDDPRGGLGADARHRAVADAAPVRAPGCARGQAGRRVRQHRLSLPRDARRQGVGAGGGYRSRRATPGSPSERSGRSSRWSRSTSTNPGSRRWRST